jgi:hypothetical protein
MRIKTLILTAALAAVGTATSMAQVYSQNAVGYVNITVKPGYNVIANPLNGTNNELNTVLLLPDTLAGASMFRFDPGTGQFASYTYAGTAFGWFPPPGASSVLDPGEGVFLQSFAGGDVTHTFVGEVAQGALSNPIVGGSFNLLASQVPQALPLGAPGVAGTLEFPAADADTAFIWNATIQNYESGEIFAAGQWFGASGANGPTIPVGGGFFLQRAGGDASWDRNFSVN